MIYKLLNNGDVLQLNINEHNALCSRVISARGYSLSSDGIGTIYPWDVGEGKIEIIDVKQVDEQGVIVLYRDGKKLRSIELIIVEGAISYRGVLPLLEDITKAE